MERYGQRMLTCKVTNKNTLYTSPNFLFNTFDIKKLSNKKCIVKVIINKSFSIKNSSNVVGINSIFHLGG